MLVNMFVLRKPAADAAATNAAATDAAVASPTTSAADSPTGPAGAVVSAKSIAVLPFDNLSKEADNAYFATGMQDEILTPPCRHP